MHGRLPATGKDSYFYPRPPRGGRHIPHDAHPLLLLISIHALREEGDRMPCVGTGIIPYFYPRPPRGGRRCLRPVQSSLLHISIHALREEGDKNILQRIMSCPVFLSTPSARRATESRSCNDNARKFLSTPSARRATLFARHLAAGQHISIHALREEGDPRSRPL